MVTKTQRTPVESVTRAAEIARRYGKTVAADRALATLTAKFRAGTVVVTVPRGAEPGQAIHLIVEGTDTGAPPLTRYQRVVLTVV